MTTITQSITTLPAAPDPATDTPAEFSTAASAYVLAQKAMVPQLNTWAGQVNTVAGEVNGHAATTAQDAIDTAADVVTTNGNVIAAQLAETNAETAETNAAASEAVALAAATALSGTSTTTLTPTLAEKVVTTQSGKSFGAGTFVMLISDSNAAVWMYGSVTSYSGTTLTFTPTAIGTATSKSDWTIAGRVGARGATGATGTGITDQATGFTATGGTTPKTLTVDADIVVSDIVAGLYGATLARSERTSNTIISTTDDSTYIDVVSGTFTQTWPAQSTLGAELFLYYKNNGTGVVTHDFDGAETCDGLATFAQYPGEERLFLWDGTTLKSVVKRCFYLVVTTTGTFQPPPGYSAFAGLITSAGSSGQRTNNIAVISAGGGGGGTSPFLLSAAAMGASQTITIGAGGAAVTTVANGNVGGDTSIGTLISVLGPSPWNVGGAILSELRGLSSTTQDGFASGTAAGLGKAVYGGGTAQANGEAGGGTSVYGGGAGGGVNASAVAAPGSVSAFAGSGGAGVSAGNGTAGTAPGGGGGATQTGTSSGAGARGEVRIWGIV